MLSKQNTDSLRKPEKGLEDGRELTSGEAISAGCLKFKAISRLVWKPEHKEKGAPDAT